MQVKLSTFNKELIRVYMESSSILEQGITYMQYINYKERNTEVSRELAQETAILQAMDFCYRKWYNDSTGYISDERVAFREFEKDVKENRYFYIRGMKSLEQIKADEAKRKAKEAERKANAEKNRIENEKKKAAAAEQSKKEKEEKQKQLWEDEKERAKALREYCKENNLDFETENAKVLKKYKNKSNLGGTIAMLSILLFIAALIMWIFTAIGSFLLWLGVMIGCFVLFCVGANFIPTLPDDYWDKIKSGKYKFE